jgi:hypothetical protein
LRLKPADWMKAPFQNVSAAMKPYLMKDIRVLAAGVAGLLVLLLLIVSITNCARRHSAEQADAPQSRPESAPRLLDEPLPDLYLVEPGKIESSR